MAENKKGGFDPDSYLAIAEKGGFDPDSYLANDSLAAQLHAGEEYPQEISDYAKKVAGKALDVATNTPGGLLRYASTPVRAAFRPNGESYLDTVSQQGGIDNLLKAIKGEYPGTPELLQAQGFTPGAANLIGLPVDFGTDPSPLAFKKLGEATKLGKFGVKELGKRLRLNALESFEPGLSKALPEGWGRLASKADNEADRLLKLNEGAIQANKSKMVNMDEMFNNIEKATDTNVARWDVREGQRASDNIMADLERAKVQRRPDYTILTDKEGVIPVGVDIPPGSPPIIPPYMENIEDAKKVVQRSFKDPANASYQKARMERRKLNSYDRTNINANIEAEKSLGNAIGGKEGLDYVDRNSKMGTLINASGKGEFRLPSRFQMLSDPRFAGPATLGTIGLAGLAGGSDKDGFNYSSAMDAAMALSVLYGLKTPQGRSAIGRAAEKWPITRGASFGVNRINSPWNDTE